MVIRYLFALFVLIGGAAMSGAYASADFPTRPVKIVAPYPPGGASDLMARVIAEGMQEALGSTVIVENRPGASGIVGAQAVGQSKGDGYTLLIGAVSLHSILPTLHDRMGEVQERLTPISRIGVLPSYVVVPVDSPHQTIQDLVDYLLANGDTISYGSAGAGTSQHVYAELFKQSIGADMVHIPYNGSAPMVVDLIGGRIDMIIEQGPAILQQIQNGQVRALAVTTQGPSKALPEIPTVASTVLPGFEATTWFAIYGSPDIPADRVEILNKAVNAALADPRIQDLLAEAGVEAEGSTVEELEQLQQADLERWAAVIEQAGISLN